MSESAQKVISELTSAGLLSADRVTDYSGQADAGIEVLLSKLVQDGHITSFQSDKLKAGKSSDIYFGDYVVIDKLGQGGMGTVLLAKHRRMDRLVAIKILPITVLESQDAVARFYQEVKVAAKLTHPNIVHAYDAGEHHGFHYLVMEYVPGYDLAEVLSQLGPIPLSMALDYLKQACKGLDYAHRKGIVHRDVKPSNILLSDEGDIKILDMGLARICDSTFNQAMTQLTTTGQVMGTVEYMSPEQAEDTRQADQRSDIYSLGCTLYRLLTGKSPFTRDTVVKTILAHRTDSIPSLNTGLPENDSVNQLFQKMVAKQPEDRFQTVSELMEAIDCVEQSDSLDDSSVEFKNKLTPADSGSDYSGSDDSASDGYLYADLVPEESIKLVPVELNGSESLEDQDEIPTRILHLSDNGLLSTVTPQTQTTTTTDDGIVYLPDPSPSTMTIGLPITRPGWPLKITTFAAGAFLLMTLFPVAFVISWFTWGYTKKLRSNQDELDVSIDRESAGRYQWVSIGINFLSIIGLIAWVIWKLIKSRILF